MVPKNHRAAGSPSLPSMQSKTYYRSRACVPTFTPESEHRKQLEANIRKNLATYVIFRYSRPLVDILATVLTLEWCLELCLKKGQGIERSLGGVGGRKGAPGKKHQGETGRGTWDGVCVGNDRTTDFRCPGNTRHSVPHQFSSSNSAMFSRCRRTSVDVKGSNGFLADTR